MTKTDCPDQPTTMVLFGVTGDLSQRYILESLFSLYVADLLPTKFRLVGASRRDWSDQDFRNWMRQVAADNDWVQTDQLDNFLSVCHFAELYFDNRDQYERLINYLAKDLSWQEQEVLFYFSVAPRFIDDIVYYLQGADLPQRAKSDNVNLRLLFEKPFGTSPEHARSLDDLLSRTFASDQLYRIDHYLAKTSFQNLMHLRFSNRLLGNDWTAENIKAINIRGFETIGINDRADFYDQVGALRDVGQSHLLQLLALATMDQPASFSASDIQAARAQALARVKVKDGVAKRGQYGGYRDQSDVPDDSMTETAFAIELLADSGPLVDVPIIVEAGKDYGEKRTEVEITFKSTKQCFCSKEPTNAEHNHVDRLIIHDAPTEGVTLSLWLRGNAVDDNLVTHDFTHTYNHLSDKDTPNAYEKLLFDAIQGDQTLFASSAEVHEAWRITMTVADKLCQVKLETYKSGQRLLVDNA